MKEEIKQIKEAILKLSDYCMMRKDIEEILDGKFCSVETCNSQKPHFHLYCCCDILSK